MQFLRISLLVAAFALAASPAWAQKGRRANSEVEVGVTRGEVGRTIGMNQFIQFAEEVLNQMLAAPGFLELIGAGEKVRMVIGDTVNNSHNDDIRVADITGRVRSQLANSGLVRIYAPGATDVDLILGSELTSTRVTGDDRSTEYSYTFTVSLTRPDGEYLGEWSADRVFVK